METERKFILNGYPNDLEMKDECVIFQYYLSVDPYIRVRKKQKNDKISYKLTIKGKGTLSRVEVEFDLDEKKFSELISICEYSPIKKIRKSYLLPDGNIFECNNVDPDTENSFFYGEVEFENEKKAKDFVPKFSFIKEVTENSGYQMNFYWQKTRIENQHFEI